MSYAKKAFKGASLIFVFSIVAAFLGYILRSILARNLTVEEYGLFFAIFTLINFVALFKDFGLSQSLPKFVPEFLAKNEHGKVKSAIMISTAFQIGVTIVLVIAAFFLSDYLALHYFRSSLAAPLLMLFMVILILNNIRELLRSVFQSFQDMVMYSWLYLAESASVLVALMLFFIISQDVFFATYAFITAYVIVTIVFTAILLKKFKFLKHKADTGKKAVVALTKELFFFGIPASLTTFGGMMILYLDTLMLTYFGTLTEVGIYNVIVPTAMLLSYFGRSITTAIFPMTSELWALQKIESLKKGVVFVQKYAFLIILPAAMLMYSFPGFILELFFGVKYVTPSAVLTFQLLIVAMIFLVIGKINLNLLTALGKPAESAKIMFAAAALNFLANLYFIPKLGMIGAALTSLLAYAFMMMLATYYLSRQIKLRIPLFDWAKILLIGVVMIPFIHWLKELLVLHPIAEAIICTASAGLIYLALAFTLKIAKLNEIKGLIGKSN